MGKESEKSGGSDYFKKLFGNVSKGALGLFLNNPFQRKPESDSQQITDADMNGTFDHGGIKHEKKKGQSSEAEAREVMDDETNKHLGPAIRKIEAVSEDNENSVQRKKKTKVMRDNDENFQQGAKNIKADNENDGELDSRKDKKKANNNGNENIVPRQKKKKTGDHNGSRSTRVATTTAQYPATAFIPITCLSALLTRFTWYQQP